MELNLLISFIGASIILAIMPGPDNILVLTESITNGKKNGIALSAGLSLGVMVHTIAAATGVSLIIQTSAIAFSIIKYFGALYLFYIAFITIKEKKTSSNIISNKISPIKLIKKGFLMNVLNPKVSLFFIALLPQFITKNGFNFTIQMIILGFIFMCISFLLFSGIANLSGRINKYINNSRFWEITKWGKVSVLGILGFILLFAKK
ncbi:MAG: LysE family translocator [Marinifilaceae bacterium]|jgi:threonine/homoserine/homoserine lactone efflux protein|nr:LysE family translocator [Marinilabiliaceae bacterium JC040]MCT4600071.1 LysE family translocator [Marinifilaceae bacterium]